jgi:hypothetical protein
MSGLIGSAAGVPVSQTSGSETERASRDAMVQQRATDAAQRSERAAGIGTTEQDQETSERDADGRRLWEAPPEKKKDPATDAAAGRRQSRDTTGQCGNNLDLTG